MQTKIVELDSQRRDAILNAALKEFASQGYDNASTNVIAKEAGISKALMFHYVKSKQELFLYVYDYFNELLNKEYYSKIDYFEKDIFARLRLSYLLQIELLKQYPCILDFNKLSAMTNSDEINRELESRAKQKPSYEIFDGIDTSRFRQELDIGKCKQFILWVNIGFIDQILNDIRNLQDCHPDYEQIAATLDDYLQELQKVFYTPIYE